MEGIKKHMQLVHYVNKPPRLCSLNQVTESFEPTWKVLYVMTPLQVPFFKGKPGWLDEDIHSGDILLFSQR